MVSNNIKISIIIAYTANLPLFHVISNLP